MTTEDFIAKAKQIHGGTYDYSPCAGKAHSVRGGMKGALEILRNS